MHFIRHGQSEFNIAMERYGRDPNIHDAPLTALGFEQAKLAARLLTKLHITKIVTSPYTRALQTASVIADELGLAFEVEPLAGERCIYSCDIGTPASVLRHKWPKVDFSHIECEHWWPQADETNSQLAQRVAAFRKKWHETFLSGQAVLVSHWYFLNSLTGFDLANGEVASKRIFS